MSEQDYGQLTFFQGDSHVNRSPKLGSEEARKMTVTSGLKCLELYGRSDQLGCLVKTCLGSSIWHSTRCYLTWKRKDTPAKHSLFQLAVSMPHTDEKESLFWPTPSTGAALCGGTGNFKTLKKMAEKGLITEEERRQLSQGNGGKTNPGLLEWLMGYEQKFTELIPTPITTDYNGGSLERYWRPSSQNIQVEREREAEARIRWCASELHRTHSAWENWPDEPGVDRVVDGIPNRLYGGINEQEHGKKSSTESSPSNGEMRDVRINRSKTEPTPYRLFKTYGGNGSLHEMPCKGSFKTSSYCEMCGVRKRICSTMAQENSENLQSGVPCRVWKDLCKQKMEHFWDNGEPNIDRVIDSCEYRSDRIKCLGNAVVPQQFYPFFAAIVKVEENDNGKRIS